MKHNFCSIASINSSENIFGTASGFARLLLIEYNHPWGEDSLAESKIPPDVKAFLTHSMHKKYFNRLLFIKNNKSSPGKINIFAVNNREDLPFINQFVIHDYTGITGLDLNACFDENEAYTYKDPVYLVCTHGKKDMCCSKFGIPVFNSLTNLDTNVWQCTHVGGDRFAPNIICLPFSHFYGHINLEEISDFYASMKEENIYIRKFRGRSCYNSTVQSADFYLRSELQDFNFNSIQLDSTDNYPDHLTSVRLLHKTSGKYYDIVIEIGKSEKIYLLTCKSKTKAPVHTYKLESIKEVAH